LPVRPCFPASLEAGKQGLTGQNIKSHSFRIGLCNEITEKFSIREAQQILCHASIETTERYMRGTMNNKTKQKILASARAPGKRMSEVYANTDYSEIEI